MLKSVAGAWMLAAVVSGTPVLAQDPASLSASVPATGAVHDSCQTVFQNPETADVENGTCVSAARGYVASLAGLDATAADQALADSVAAIAPLAIEDPACNAFDHEIAAAIRILGTRSSTPEQAAQIEEIAATIEDCAPSETAAIPGAAPTIPDGPAGSASPS